MPMEYNAQVDSESINGNAKLMIEDDGITMSALFEAGYIPYTDISAFKMQDYAIQITAQTGIFKITRLGNACEAFFDELYAAYNEKVRKALFVEEALILRTQAAYHYTEREKTAQGTAYIEVYARCVLILPPDSGARRIPLCFTRRMDEGDYSLSLELDTGERYSFNRLGHDSAVFLACIKKCMHSLRENAVHAIKAVGGTLHAAQIAELANILPEGAAAPMGRLYEIAPSFADALEANILKSRVAKEYQILKEYCDPMRMCVGIKSGLANEYAEHIPWMIVPGKGMNMAAVELATGEETAAATFIYGPFEDWDLFWRMLNHAMEAIDFRREVIRLRDDELQSPEYAGYRMAIMRNCALQRMRCYFAGRVIHSSPERWKKGIEERIYPGKA